MKNKKAINAFVMGAAIIFPTMLIASTKGKTPSTEEEPKKLTVPQKVGKESARVVNQVEEAGHDITSAFKKKHHKDKEHK